MPLTVTATDPYVSPDPIEITYHLTNLYLSHAAKDDAESAKLLKRFRDTVWPLQSPTATPEQREALTQEILGIGSKQGYEKQKTLLTGMLRLGQLYDVAAIVARGNAFDENRKNLGQDRMADSTGGVEDFFQTFINTHPSKHVISSALQALAQPVSEIVMTAHPTNVNAIESLKALRNLGKAIHSYRKDAENKNQAKEDIQNAIEELYHADPIPMKKGTPGSITVKNETETVLYYLDNLYDDIPQIYKGFEEPIDRLSKGGKLTGKFKPLDLKLNIKYSSWAASGDKDGNQNVNSDTTLEAILLSKVRLFSRYLADMDALEDPAKTALNDWQEILNSRREIYAGLLKEVESYTSENKFIPHNVFEGIMGQLPKTEIDDSVKFATRLEEVYRVHPSQGLLNLARRARTFGLHYAKVEYRETAEEYARVVSALVPEYGRVHQKCLEQHQKLEKIHKGEAVAETKDVLETKLEQLEFKKRHILEDLLQDDRGAQLLRHKLAGIIAEGQGRKYSDEDAAPIAYHTIKRMELAREFPDMITANVLAECQNTSNILEAVFLQKICTKDDKRPIMGIVPLFEEPETMQRITSILGDAYQATAYKDHMRLVADHLSKMGWRDDKLRQQVQIAHSDNARRSGFLAARSFIDEAHTKVRELNKQHGITTEFFEGGSLSDAYRGGVRSISAAVNEYGLHDFMKFTFQGGDLPNYFGSPGSVVRLYTRNLAHAAKQLMANGHASEKEPSDIGVNLAEYNAVAREALQGTLSDYQENIFSEAKMGRFLKAAWDPYGNVSSRAPARKGPVKAVTDPETVRTIGFSETFQHAGVLPTFLGAKSLEGCLLKALRKRADLKDRNNPDGYYRIRLANPLDTEKKDVLAVPEEGSGQPLNPELFGVMYYKSAVFRNAVDGMAYGLIMSDIDALRKNFPQIADDPFVTRMEEDYRAAARIVINALHEPEMSEQRKWRKKFSSERPDLLASNPNTPLGVLRNMVLERLPHLQETVQHKMGFMDVAAALKAGWRQEREWEEKKAADPAFTVSDEEETQHGWMMRLVHGVIDTVTHGRILMADDPLYMRMKHPEFHDTRKKSRDVDVRNPVERLGIKPGRVGNPAQVALG